MPGGEGRGEELGVTGGGGGGRRPFENMTEKIKEKKLCPVYYCHCILFEYIYI